MMQNYVVKLYREPRQVSENVLNIGYVYERKTKTPVLVIESIKDFTKITRQTCALFGEKIKYTTPNGILECGLVQMDEMVYKNEIVNDNRFAKVSIMHELGHYINNHIERLKKEGRNDYSIQRKSNIGVSKEELEADEFAIRECGIDDFVYFIDMMIKYRQSKQESLNNKQIALIEFALRKKHGLEYSKTI